MEYEAFFQKGLEGTPYKDDEEAVEEALALVDFFLNAAFEGRDIRGERLEMRGVVVTPQECEAALKDRIGWYLRESRKEEKEQEGREKLKAGFGRIMNRGSAGGETRLWKLLKTYSLTPLEIWSFLLAMALEFDRKYERIYGYIQDNVGAKRPTLGLSLSLFGLMCPKEERSRLWLETSSLLWENLLEKTEPGEGESSLSRPLALQGWVIRWLRGEENRIRKAGETSLSPWAVPVKLVYEWEDLVLEDVSEKLLRQVCAQVQYREQVMETWGFGKKSPYGNGISALFYGAPGTGKTMAAQVMARHLGMELYRVDTSCLVSKYIGETEKNISDLFKKAEKKQAILFFDEADGLFSKRSEVKSSNDRYANMETGFLLQKFEDYQGVSILAANFANNMDDAFKRRLGFLIPFVFPSSGQRERLWKNMFPAEAKLEEALDYAGFAQKMELSGSAIREISLGAAYVAASKGRGIRNEDVYEAAASHYLKYGKHWNKDQQEES